MRRAPGKQEPSGKAAGDPAGVGWPGDETSAHMGEGW